MKRREVFTGRWENVGGLGWYVFIFYPRWCPVELTLVMDPFSKMHLPLLSVSVTKVRHSNIHLTDLSPLINNTDCVFKINPHWFISYKNLFSPSYTLCLLWLDWMNAHYSHYYRTFIYTNTCTYLYVYIRYYCLVEPCHHARCWICWMDLVVWWSPMTIYDSYFFKPNPRSDL